MVLNQERCAFYLRQVDTERGFRDVVTAYLFQKYINGNNSTQVFCKLRYLILYLRTSLDTAALVERWGSSVAWIGYHVRDLNGGAIGSTAGISPVGRLAWNEARSSPRYKSVAADETWGRLGPGAVRMLPWVATGDEREEALRSMDPESLELLGAPNIPGYRTGTLPAYLSHISTTGAEAGAAVGSAE